MGLRVYGLGLALGLKPKMYRAAVSMGTVGRMRGPLKVLRGCR